MHQLQLSQQISAVTSRIRRLLLWQQLTLSWFVLSIIVVCWTLFGNPPLSISTLCGALGVAVVIAIVRTRTQVLPQTDVSRQIEQAFPDLNARLLAALEQVPDRETGRLNILQQQVVSEVMHHARMNDWTKTVSPKKMSRAFWSQTAAFASFLLLASIAMQVQSKSASAISSSNNSNSILTETNTLVVEPGDTDLERGTSLLILARFENKTPAEVRVTWTEGTGAEQSAMMTKSLDDPIFATRLPSIKEDTVYRIEYDGNQSQAYRVSVYDLPTLIRSDLTLTYPSYTNQPPKTLPDAFDVSVVEGTRVEITCKVNKPLAQAKLVGSDDVAIDMQVDSSDPTLFRYQSTPTKRMKFKLELADEGGRKNRDPEEFRIDVIPNRPPDLAVVFPGKDVKVSPLEEIQIEYTALDDFGVIETGLVFQVAGRDPVTTVLGKDLKGSAKHNQTSLQRLEDYRAQPDDLVTYYLYAKDHGPDGQVRLTNSDVFFAEVRSYDEIFRQVDQQSPMEADSPQKPPENLTKLIELQRKIVVSSWKLTRTTDATWNDKTTEELSIVHTSQQQAIQKLSTLRETMTQPQLQPIFSTIADAMELAQQELAQSLHSKNVAPLLSAIPAEQNAYQGLLKLRSKEHYLKQSKGKGSGQDTNEERADLELKPTEERYESEKAGSVKEESNVNKEALAVLDRLKDLARRQEGINQQLKELEAQSRQAKTDAEREEIDRQLKRLREEQQQLLQDTDELRSKLNNSTQQEKMTETKNQLEQTRQRLVDTAEKLRENQVSQALNAGTRAERELKQLHDEFRNQTSAQFADAMRNLREQARRVAEQQDRLSQQLSDLGDESRRTLRQSQERSQLQSEFQQQRQQANEIVDKAKQVVDQAENAEPLLAKQLYDTLRSTRETKLDQAMNATMQMLKQGVIPEAINAERQAKKGIEQLRAGIEKAAEGVLGNEVESLKRAKRELAELTERLGKEIDSSSPKNAGNSPAGSNGDQPGTPTPSGKPGSAGSPDQAAESKPGTPGAEGNGQPSNQPGGETPGSQGTGRASGDGQGSSDGSSDATLPTSKNPPEKPSTPDRPTAGGLRRNAPQSGGDQQRSSAAPGKQASNGDDKASMGGGPGNSQGGGPITGGDFNQFNERLRDIESMVSDPQMQAEVQKVRDRARSVRAEFKRHTNSPNWDLVRTSVHEPMMELQQRLADEIAKRESPDSLVPVDRDPVPTRYRDLVRNYYEKLGAGKDE